MTLTRAAAKTANIPLAVLAGGLFAQLTGSSSPMWWTVLVLPSATWLLVIVIALIMTRRKRT